jgi:hypothetical protein
MLPPDEKLPAPAGDIVPYPGSALSLGAGKWLLRTGVITEDPLGEKVELTPQTLAYWERVAQQKHGKTLGELII